MWFSLWNQFFEKDGGLSQNYWWSSDPDAIPSSPSPCRWWWGNLLHIRSFLPILQLLYCSALLLLDSRVPSSRVTESNWDAASIPIPPHHLPHPLQINLCSRVQQLFSLRQFLSDPSPIIALPCQLVTHWVTLLSSSWDLTDVSLACEDQTTSPKVTQTLLNLQNFAKPNSHWSSVQILKLKFCQNFKAKL